MAKTSKTTRKGKAPVRRPVTRPDTTAADLAADQFGAPAAHWAARVGAFDTQRNVTTADLLPNPFLSIR